MSHEKLRSIYLAALDSSSPQRLVSRFFDDHQSLLPRFSRSDVIALGKAAAGMVQGLPGQINPARCFIGMPEGYGDVHLAPKGCDLHVGSHPELSDSSFRAGAALTEFVSQSTIPLIVLVSGGSSACVEKPLQPWFSDEELIRVNHSLTRAGWPIEQINLVRKHLSALKGGRLGAMLPPGSIGLILSDVNLGKPELVGSGPLFGDRTTNIDAAELVERLGFPSIATRLRSGTVPETPKQGSVETFTIGDNQTLLAGAAKAAAEAGMRAVVSREELNGDVESVAASLVEQAEDLGPGVVLIAGGEPTVEVRGSGRGGRCTEVGVRFARRLMAKRIRNVVALFGSSDGRDGNSGTAGCVILGSRVQDSALADAKFDAALRGSDTLRLIRFLGEPIIIPPTGNNLRDLFLVART